ncbi:hypothetical protein [Neptunomonas antarctica]|uniref:Uncharacterized protein n=1 Tax=Neptunomonas antarctica TaxID=619304 RepID=A0A1N7JE09_9GAMM|nr:hypothetical protein [Neptunomonas antarctica]SIS47548.1 hypothetical protein SAMN05421760_1011012 [Neptunomonas antarctica]
MIMSICYEISNNPFFLSQYYKIREDCFRSDLCLSDFNGSKDEYDMLGQILIIREGDLCLGGARLNGRKQGDTVRLPMESETFELRDVCSDILLDNNSYCQWSRLAIDPKFRKRVNFSLLCEKMLAEAIKLGYLYSFNVTGSVRTRFFQKIHRSLGFSYHTLSHVDIHAEDGFEDLPHLLGVARLDKKPVFSSGRLDKSVA